MTTTVEGWGVATADESAASEQTLWYAMEVWSEVLRCSDANISLPRQLGFESRQRVQLATVPADPADRASGGRIEMFDRFGPCSSTRTPRHEQAAIQLGHMAVSRAFQAAQLSPDSITHLVTVSCRDSASSGVDFGLLETLPLRKDIVRSHVGYMDFHAAFSAWRVATAFAASDNAFHVLVCCIDDCSSLRKHSIRSERTGDISRVARAAAALIIHSTPDSRAENWSLASQQSFIVPQTSEMMTWHSGKNGFQMSLSPQIAEIIRTRLKPWVSRWLSAHGLTTEDVGSWAVLPGCPSMLNLCESSLGLCPDTLQSSRESLERFENMLSPTMMFMMDKLQREGARRPCVSLAIGPGITFEGALWQ